MSNLTDALAFAARNPGAVPAMGGATAGSARTGIDQALARALQASGVVTPLSPATPVTPNVPVTGAMRASNDAGAGDDPELDAIHRDTQPQQPSATYVPASAISRQYRLADALRNQPQATSPWGVIAQGLGAVGGNLIEGSANRAQAANDTATLDAIRRAGGAGNSTLMAKALMSSSNPTLAMSGLQMLAKSGDSDATMALRRAQAAEAQAKAGYYNRDRSGYTGMEGVRWENVIQRAAKADPEFDADPLGTIDKYRKAYMGARSSYGAPAVGSLPGRPSAAEATTRLNQARDAIAKGAPRDEVKKMLEGLGIDSSGL